MAENRLNITLEYCRPWNYTARAAWTAQELLGTFGEWTEGITLIPGANGVFEVAVNGKQVYSKKATGRFPEMQELNEAVRKFLE